MYSKLQKHPVLKQLYDDALQWPEFKTTALWEYYLNKGPFKDLEWVVASQQPRSNGTGDLTRMDIQISSLTTTIPGLFHIMPVEAKKHNASLPAYDVLESQVFQAALAMVYDGQRTRAWGATVAGPRIRVWVYSAEQDYLSPFMPPGSGLSDREDYIDLFEHWEWIGTVFEMAKATPVPPEVYFSTFLIPEQSTQVKVLNAKANTLHCQLEGRQNATINLPEDGWENRQVWYGLELHNVSALEGEDHRGEKFVYWAWTLSSHKGESSRKGKGKGKAK